MHRVVIFSDILAPAPVLLLDATLAAVARRRDFEVVAVCTPRERGRARFLWRCFAGKLPLYIRAADVQAPPRRRSWPHFPDLERMARQHRFALVDPPGGRINAPQFVDFLQRKFRPTLALSFYSQQKFGGELLGIFTHAVNYHNGLLPAYRGLKATSWSIYHGEQQTGFTFHRMTKEIDEGPILLDGAIPIDPGHNAADLDRDKAFAAAQLIPQVLAMVANDEPGRPQAGTASYFSKNDWEELTIIQEPCALSSEELTKRLRAFNTLRLKIDGKWRNVTHLRKLPAGGGIRERRCFRTIDGAHYAPIKCRRVPFVIWAVANWLGRRQLISDGGGGSD